MNPIINFWLKQLSRLFLVFPKKKECKEAQKECDIVYCWYHFTLLHCWAASNAFFGKTLHDKFLGSTVFRLSLTIPIHNLICFTQMFANNMKPSQTWCFTILGKSYLTYHRVKTIFKKAPHDRLLAWLGVNPDLSRLQNKRVSMKSAYWLHDVVGPEGSIIENFYYLLVENQLLFSTLCQFTNLHKVNGLERCWQWMMQWIFSEKDGDSVSALECKWTLCTADNECMNTSLDKKKNDTWQACFTEVFEGIHPLLRHPQFWRVSAHFVFEAKK